MRRWSIATRFFAWQLCLIGVLVAALGTALYLDSARQVEDATKQRMLSLAVSISLNPFVIDSIEADARANDSSTGSVSAALQPYAESLMDSGEADFVTIMRPDRTRFTHRETDMIGGKFTGTIDTALAGTAFTEVYSGSLGPSIRAVAPIRGADGSVIGLVSTGITVATTNIAVAARLPLVAGIAAMLLVGGALAALGIRRYLSRVTFGRGPEEIGQMYALYDAVLHSIGEGMLLVNSSGSIVLHNEQALRLLGVGSGGVGSGGAESGVSGSGCADAGIANALDVDSLPPELASLVASRREVDNEIVITTERILVVSQRAAIARRRGNKTSTLGTVVLLRDRTDVQRLSTELDTVRTMADALRSQTHEHANRLHTMITLFELGRGEDAVQFATDDLRQGQQLTDRVMESVDEPALSALLIGKITQANERGIDLALVSHAQIPAGLVSVYEMVTVLGNLIDNALDAAAEQADPENRWVEVELLRAGGDIVINVIDGGFGLRGASPDRIFQRGFSTKSPEGTARGIGLSLVHHTVHKLGGTVVAEDSLVPGKGARFTVTIPLPAVAAGSGSGAGSGSADDVIDGDVVHD